MRFLSLYSNAGSGASPSPDCIVAEFALKIFSCCLRRRYRMNDPIAIATDRVPSGMPRPIPILLAVDTPVLAPEFDGAIVVDFGLSEVAMAASVGVEATVSNDETEDDGWLANEVTLAVCFTAKGNMKRPKRCIDGR